MIKKYKEVYRRVLPRFIVILLLTLFTINVPVVITVKADDSNSLGDRIKSELNSAASGTDAAAKAAGSAMDNLVKTARQIGILVIVGVILFAAYAFIFAGARKIAEYKVHALIVIVAIIFLFRTEAILISVLKLVGADDILRQLYGA